MKIFKIGREQLVIFAATTLVTITTDLLVGVAFGIVVKIVIHVIHGAPVKSLFRPDIEERMDEDGRVVIRVKHAALFSNYLSLKKRIERHTAAPVIEVDFADARLVDHTVIANLHDLGSMLEREGRTLITAGLDAHDQLSEHPLAARRKISLTPAPSR